MMTNTYNVLSEELEHVQEDGSIHVKFDHTLVQHICDDDNSIEQNDNVDDANSMLESNLRNLYQSARQQHKHNRLQIKLHTQPISAHIQSLYIIPVLTRSHVKSNPCLKHKFVSLLSDSKVDHDPENDSMMDLGRNFFGKLADLEDRVNPDGDYFSNTVVAQVSIVCREVFEVRDYSEKCTNDDTVSNDDPSLLLQGTDGVERDVIHLVRFEKIVEVSKETGEKVGEGSWQITDWDDLLEGNIWF